jgi:hypothetical protein
MDEATVAGQELLAMPQPRRRKKDDALLLPLVCGATVEAAADKAGVSRATAFRRLQDPDFRHRLEELRSEIVQRAADALSAASTEAIKTLLSLLPPSMPPSTRLQAARSILEFGIKMRDATVLDQRLKALEERIVDRERHT